MAPSEKGWHLGYGLATWGTVFVDRGDHAAALEVYERFLERNPDDEEAQRTTDWLRGQLERARR